MNAHIDVEHAASTQAPSAWDQLIGQAAAVAQLRPLAEHPDTSTMTHAWLITGPPGSGRSNLARVFAQALVCERHTACGECHACTLARSGTHPDVTALATENVIIKIDDVRELVNAAQLSPALGRFRVQIVEDADRMLERTTNVLLKSLEEPPAQTIWILCAPSELDVLPTIRSRCRSVRLVSPSTEEVAALLEQTSGVSHDIAVRASREAQNHVGMARRLATDAAVRQRRDESLDVVLNIATPSQAVRGAQQLVELATADSHEADDKAAELARTELLRQLGLTEGDKVPPAYRAQLRAAEAEAKRRGKRSLMDGIDRILVDLTTLVRDALLVTMGVDVPLVNEERRRDVAALSRRVSSAGALRRLEAIDVARRRIAANVQPLTALEAMLMEFVQGQGS